MCMCICIIMYMCHSALNDLSSPRADLAGTECTLTRLLLDIHDIHYDVHYMDCAKPSVCPCSACDVIFVPQLLELYDSYIEHTHTSSIIGACPCIVVICTYLGPCIQHMWWLYGRLLESYSAKISVWFEWGQVIYWIPQLALASPPPPLSPSLS